MTHGVIEEIRRHEDEFIELRQRIHRHPELGFEERATSELVANKLTEWGYQVHRGLAGTGVIGQLRRGDSIRKLGIRADMDALPIEEATGLPYASEVPGCMHACGHDGHTAILLAAAYHMAHYGNFNGTLNLIFQPAEEGRGGGQKMLEEGLFDQFPCDMVFALHNGPKLPVGTMVVQAGPMAASSDNVHIVLHGKGGHCGTPHLSNDPIVALGALIGGLQTIVSRNVPPNQPAVVSIGKVQAGESCNVIPMKAELMLTVRTFDPEVQALIEQRLRAMVQGYAESYGLTAEVNWKPITRVLINHAEPSRLARLVAQRMLGERALITLPTGTSLGAEDFSWMAEKVPGCYVALGNGVDGHNGQMLHHPDYDFNDAVLSLGASYWVNLAQEYLK